MLWTVNQVSMHWHLRVEMATEIRKSWINDFFGRSTKFYIGFSVGSLSISGTIMRTALIFAKKGQTK